MKVAVIGAGISGISAAWHLDQQGVDVHLLESSLRLGGHTHTHTLPVRHDEVRVDTGFIVFNEHNYPNFSRWLEQLDVPVKASEMSFAVRDDLAGLEYGTTDLRAMTSNAGQLLRPGYLKMWLDLWRFYRDLRDGDIADVTLGEYLHDNRYSSAFIHSHIVPMCAALWSQPASQSLNLSLRHVVDFMRNHKMLQISERPQWRVVEGGSSAYLQAFQARFGGRISTNMAATRVERQAAGVVVRNGARREVFDAVVMACHSDQALAALVDPSATEQAVLGHIPYQRNHVYLHSDPAFMPRNRDCWSSWNVQRDRQGDYTITYWMNRLQGLSCDEQFFVTLNPSRQPSRVHWQGRYQHPQFDQSSLAAQQRWDEISYGPTFYAGAYWGSGFHEAGFDSGLRCASALVNQVSARAA